VFSRVPASCGRARIGDGVQLWPRILADVESGCPQSEYTANDDSDNLKVRGPRFRCCHARSFVATTSLIATRRLSRPVRVLPTASERDRESEDSYSDIERAGSPGTERESPTAVMSVLSEVPVRGSLSIITHTKCKRSAGRSPNGVIRDRVLILRQNLAYRSGQPSKSRRHASIGRSVIR
jgi:hypothetical protein